MTTTTTGTRRAGPPQAIQKVRENYFLIQVLLTGSPSADWRRLFYEARHEAAGFEPRSVEVTGALLRFRSDPESVGQKIGWIDHWAEYANEKEAAMSARSEGQRQKREGLAHEAEELAALNARWAKL